MKKFFLGKKKDLKVNVSVFGRVAVCQIDAFCSKGKRKGNNKGLVILFDCIPGREGTKGNIHPRKVERHRI